MSKTSVIPSRLEHSGNRPMVAGIGSVLRATAAMLDAGAGSFHFQRSLNSADAVPRDGCAAVAAGIDDAEAARSPLLQEGKLAGRTTVHSGAQDNERANDATNETD